MNKKLLTLTFAALLAGTAVANAAADKGRPPLRPDRPSPEMMEAKLADRLNLSSDQILAMQDRRKSDQLKIKDLMDQMKELRTQMNEIRKSNMEAFESILNPEQKAEFEKIKAEKKARHMERKKMHHNRPDMPAMEKDMDMAPSDVVPTPAGETPSEDRPPLNTRIKPISPDTIRTIQDKEPGMVIEPEDDEEDMPGAVAEQPKNGMTK